MISKFTKTAVRLVARTNIPNKICLQGIYSARIQDQQGLMTHKNCFGFAKISKKDKDRQKDK